MALPTRMQLQIVSADRSLVNETVDEVEIPGSDGYFGVLPGHTPLVALIRIGDASYRSGKGESHVVIGGGFCEVSKDVVTVLCDFAQLPDEIDLAAAQKEKAQAEEEMKTVGPDTFDAVQARLDAANARVQVASRH